LTAPWRDACEEQHRHRHQRHWQQQQQQDGEWRHLVSQARLSFSHSARPSDGYVIKAGLPSNADVVTDQPTGSRLKAVIVVVVVVVSSAA